MSAPYPWLAPVWERLLAARERAAQGLLIGGPAGVGKRALARAWARALLCEAPTADGAACGACVACHWFDAGTHPDFRLLTLVEKTRDGVTRLATRIDVEQAREAVDYIQLSTHRAGWRVLLIDPADALNLPAANALLKALEEPPPRTAFVLVADRPRQLLPTIRSRCQRQDIGVPPAAEALAWLVGQGVADPATRLALAGGAPLAAPESGDDAARRALLAALARPEALAPVALAESWKDIPQGVWHAVVYKWLTDLLAASQGAAARFNPDFSAELVKLGPRVAVSGLLKLARVQADAGRSLAHPLNQVLQREAWLLQYRNLFPRKPAR